jgi:hypothetical protein
MEENNRCGCGLCLPISGCFGFFAGLGGGIYAAVKTEKLIVAAFPSKWHILGKVLLY